MERQFYFIGIAFFGMVNGMFHPLRVVTFVVTNYFMAFPLFGSPSLILFFSALMLSTATVILGGIPAALYERFAGIKDDSNVVSLWIWLAFTGLLTVPSIEGFRESGFDRRPRHAIAGPQSAV